MRFACDSCGSLYRLADDKVRGLLVEVRCRSCGAIVTLRDGVPEPAGDAPIATPPPVPPMQERLWFALVAGKQEGPLSDQALDREIAGGRVGASTFVWHEGMADWQRLSDVQR